MKHGILASMFLLVIGSAAVAQEKVLVLPFEAVGPEQGQKGWVARALQQNLMAELSRAGSVKPASATAAAGDQEAAIRAGEAAGAKYVVFGTYQSVESDLRITGQVVDVSTKQAIAGLKATGTLRDLFGLEDTIAAQVKKALPGAAMLPAAPAAAGEMLVQPRPAEAPPAIAPRGPLEMGRAARAADELADEMGRAIERIRYRNTWEEERYYDRPNRYRRSYGHGYGYPYYGYPIFISPGNVVVPPGGGVIGKAPGAQRYPGRTEYGQPRLSFPSFTPERKFPNKSAK
jgi:TolB-like protein